MFARLWSICAAGYTLPLHLCVNHMYVFGLATRLAWITSRPDIINPYDILEIYRYVINSCFA